MHSITIHQLDQMRASIQLQMKTDFGIEDSSGIEILMLIRMLANLSIAVENCQNGEDEISGARWRILLRLVGEEKKGNMDGLNPTTLSHAHRVSKNTISALVKGLEEQGLVQRNLEPTDFRKFRIQLTDAGRDLIHKNGSSRAEQYNQLAGQMTLEERHQLIDLLIKLHHSLAEISKTVSTNVDGG